MKKVVVGTDLLIDHAHGYAEWISLLLKQEETYQFIVPTIVAAEYLSGQEVETKRGEEEAKEHLSLFVLQDFTFEVAEVLGRISRRKTYPSGASVSDLIVASTSVYLHAELATRNRAHFHGIPDLRFFNPEKLKKSS